MRSNNSGLIRFGSKSFLLTAAVLLIIGCTISGTVAWMFVKSAPVNNTFTYGGIEIELTETDTEDNDDNDKTNTYSFTPEAVIAKDPLITVKANSESCWLFVKAEASGNFHEFMEYDMAEGWKSLTNEDGVYYRTVEASDQDQKFTVLEGNAVTVKGSVTQEALDALDPADYPTLEFTSYAVQNAEVDSPEAAWALVD